MLEGLFLAWYSAYSGGSLGTLFDQWEQLGVFDYMLPFLLIFALIFGILSKMNLFGDKNKQISGIIALVVGLMALRFNVVSVFFSDIFPRLGIALGAFLVFLIVLGLFGDPKSRGLLNTMMWGAFGVAVVIVLQSTEMFGMGGISSIFELIPGWLIPIIVLIVLVAIVIAPKKTDKPPIESWLGRAFGAPTNP